MRIMTRRDVDDDLGAATLQDDFEALSVIGEASNVCAVTKAAIEIHVGDWVMVWGGDSRILIKVTVWRTEWVHTFYGKKLVVVFGESDGTMYECDVYREFDCVELV